MEMEFKKRWDQILVIGGQTKCGFDLRCGTPCVTNDVHNSTKCLAIFVSFAFKSATLNGYGNKYINSSEWAMPPLNGNCVMSSPYPNLNKNISIFLLLNCEFNRDHDWIYTLNWPLHNRMCTNMLDLNWKTVDLRAQVVKSVLSLPRRRPAEIIDIYRKVEKKLKEKAHELRKNRRHNRQILRPIVCFAH